jgi:hypothetical protein
MSTIEIIAFGTLWFVIVMLALLLLLLYRQVERAYERAALGQAAGLPPGTEAPEIEVLTADGTETFGFPDDEELALLAFVSSDCAACDRLLEALRLGVPQVNRTVIAARSESEDGERFANLPAPLEVIWPAYPGSILHDYGVRVVPLCYLSRRNRVVASGAPSSRTELDDLVASSNSEAGAKVLAATGSAKS